MPNWQTVTWLTNDVVTETKLENMHKNAIIVREETNVRRWVAHAGRGRVTGPVSVLGGGTPVPAEFKFQVDVAGQFYETPTTTMFSSGIYGSLIQSLNNPLPPGLLDSRQYRVRGRILARFTNGTFGVFSSFGTAARGMIFKTNDDVLLSFWCRPWYNGELDGLGRAVSGGLFAAPFNASIVTHQSTITGPT